MTAIERTAYPSFKQQPSPQELTELYTPTLEELAFAQAQSASKSGGFRVYSNHFNDWATFPLLNGFPSLWLGTCVLF